MAVISGLDQRYGDQPFINSLFLMHTGGPGAPHAWLTTVHLGDLGLCYLDSVEIDEFAIRSWWLSAESSAILRAPDDLAARRAAFANMSRPTPHRSLVRQNRSQEQSQHHKRRVPAPR
jgi:hypothetical protein